MKVQKSFSKQKTGTLFLIPTPIGNLGDITLRAIEILKVVDLIASEDTRHTIQLLNQFKINTKQMSFHEHNKETRIPVLVDRLLQGDDIAQVSDAGMPSISDPGHELVKAALKNDVPVISVPGASAGITALIASGLAPQPFVFYGFLPRKFKEQQIELERLSQYSETILIYESPHRLLKTLMNISILFGSDRHIVLARELTKRYEEFLRGTVDELLEWMKIHQARGEFVIIIEGTVSRIQENKENDVLFGLSNLEAIDVLVKKGVKTTLAVKEIAKKRQLKRQTLYLAYQEWNEDNKKKDENF